MKGGQIQARRSTSGGTLVETALNEKIQDRQSIVRNPHFRQDQG